MDIIEIIPSVIDAMIVIYLRYNPTNELRINHLNKEALSDLIMKRYYRLFNDTFVDRVSILTPPYTISLHSTEVNKVFDILNDWYYREDAVKHFATDINTNSYNGNRIFDQVLSIDITPFAGLLFNRYQITALIETYSM